MKIRTKLLAGTAIALKIAITAGLLVTSSQAGAQSLKKDQKAEINQMIETYINENPQVILDALENYRVQQMEEAEAKANEKAGELMAAIRNNPDQFPVVGNDDGNIIVAEFFDYNCGYCKKAFEGVQEVLDNEDDVKVALIELPILGPSSLLASQWSLAVLKQDKDKYWDFHRELMTFQGQKTEATLTEMAERVGLDVEQLKQDAQSEDVQNEIAANRQFAEDMGVSGTPGFVIESEVIRGYVPYDQMKDIIEAERQKKEG